jgi:hypothetical protein
VTAAVKEVLAAKAVSHPMTRIAAIKVRLIELWPPSLVGFGVVLTVVWCGVWLWLLMRLLATIL